MPTQMTKSRLLDAILSARTQWEVLLAKIDEEQLISPGENSEWSVKDVFAHLTAWEWRAVAWLEAVQNKEQVKPAEWPSGLGEDETNAWIYGKYRDRPLDEIIHDSARVHRRLVELIEALPEEDLMASGRLASLRGSSLLDAIPGNSYEHYRDHSETNRAWLDRARG